jgi:hypothetical protein
VLLQDAEIPPLLRRYQYIDLRDGNIAREVLQLVLRIDVTAVPNDPVKLVKVPSRISCPASPSCCWHQERILRPARAQCWPHSRPKKC